jgi:DNA-binding LacI/PurR family transcriptional regulator
MNDELKKGKRVTINDIARISGYSKTAVSFAFNDPSRISVKACATIQRVAEELGYYPDPLARKFSLQRHESIGFLLPQHIHFSFQNPYIMQVVEGIGSVCQKYGNTLTLIPPLNESVLDAVRCAAVDGLITQGMSVEMEIVDSIKKRKLPFVTIDGIPSVDMPSINIDDKDAAYSIMRMVLERGHKRIAIIGLAEVSYEKHAPASIQRARLEGYLRALKEFDLDFSSPSVGLYTSETTLDEGKHMASMLLSGRFKPTCVVSMSDIVALGCILQFTEQGISVPEDISVVGFDNIVESSYILPSLTTIDQPAGEKGRRAAEMLFTLIRGEHLPQTHITIPHRIIERDSLSSIEEQNEN